MPAAMEITSGRLRCSVADRAGSTAGSTCGLTASTRVSTPDATDSPDGQMVMPQSSYSAFSLSSSVSYTQMFSPRKPPPAIPRMMAPAMFPAPTKPTVIPAASFPIKSVFLLFYAHCPPLSNAKSRRPSPSRAGMDDDAGQLHLRAEIAVLHRLLLRVIGG